MILITIIVCITLIVITALVCFKGITFHKKMEVLPTPIQTSCVRPTEMDDIEKKLNEVDAMNRKNDEESEHVPHNEQKGYAGGTTAMDYALRTIQNVFGPEQDSDINTGGR